MCPKSSFNQSEIVIHTRKFAEWPLDMYHFVGYVSPCIAWTLIGFQGRAEISERTLQTLARLAKDPVLSYDGMTGMECQFYINRAFRT